MFPTPVAMTLKEHHTLLVLVLLLCHPHVWIKRISIYPLKPTLRESLHILRSHPTCPNRGFHPRANDAWNVLPAAHTDPGPICGRCCRLIASLQEAIV